MYCGLDPGLAHQLGFSEDELPALGASPDAMICHRLPIRPVDLQEGLALMQQLLGLGKDPEPSQPHAVLGTLSDWTRYSPGPSSGAAGNRDVAAKVASEALLRRAISNHQAAPSDGAAGAHAVPVGGQADATGGGAGSMSLQSSWQESVALVSGWLLKGDAEDATRDSSGSDEALFWVTVREAVEVKNHSPFVFKWVPA